MNQKYNPIKYCIDCGCELILGDNWTKFKMEHYRYLCNSCKTKKSNLWLETKKGKQASKKYAQSKKGKATSKKYRQTDNFKESQKTLVHELRNIHNNLKLGFGCAICGFNEYPESLDFHHINPKDKKYCISKETLSRDDIFDELQKCMCLCANCHRHITMLEGGD